MKCRVCSCTDEEGCAGGCSWSEAGLCSTCKEAAEEIAAQVENWLAEGPKPSRTALLREVDRILQDAGLLASPGGRR